MTDNDIKRLVQDYQNGMSIYDVCGKYHLGKIRIKIFYLTIILF